jgi:transmembrane sensor
MSGLRSQETASRATSNRVPTATTSAEAVRTRKGRWHPVKIQNVTAWQRGQVVLDDVPVVEALETLNRYSHTQIVIRSTFLPSRRISGRFRAGDVDTEALTLRRYFDLKETARSDGLIVLEQN